MRISGAGLIATFVVLGMNTGSSGQERPAGSGVLCAYTVLSGALLDAKLCGWEDTAQGKVVGKAVADIEAYMRANFADPTDLDHYRTNFANGVDMMKARGDEAISLYCRGLNPDLPNYFGAMRFEKPEEIDVTDLLSQPGEPTYGDCF
jgi:hypothetical protein